MKSIEYKNGADAIAKIKEIESLDELTTFIEGEERKTVLAASALRTVKLSPASEEPNQLEAKGTVATHACWRYHKTEEPKMFKQNESIPDGWSDEDLIGWVSNIDGTWSKREK